MAIKTYMRKASQIANIKKAERERETTNMNKGCKGLPFDSISHLLFADDSLFFIKAQKDECQTIIRILKEYEATSGQLINFQIQFGHKIEEPIRQKLRDILGI